MAVVDASVALKWFFRQRDDEAHTERAIALLERIGAGQLRMVQPPHFVAEVAAVLARKQPAGARSSLLDLQRLEWEVDESPAIYAAAFELSAALQHHLFDTLYHATALHTEGATLITADTAYYAKAHGRRGIARLQDL
ncbi:MAG: type II toxin-antitoxin system VapC family toxin [Proteobacteria bacterium]|nr:type II toxin-antitoxin system VapC family toxin [Pseudomonadota bacterium]